MLNFDAIGNGLAEVKRIILNSEDILTLSELAGLNIIIYSKMEDLRVDLAVLNCTHKILLLEEKALGEKAQVLQYQYNQLHQLHQVLGSAVAGFANAMGFLKTNSEYVRVFLIWHRNEFIMNYDELSEFLIAFPFYVRLVVDVFGKGKFIKNMVQLNNICRHLESYNYKKTADFIRSWWSCRLSQMAKVAVDSAVSTEKRPPAKPRAKETEDKRSQEETESCTLHLPRFSRV